VTNAGAEHLEGFVDLDGVAAGEGEIFEALSPDATAVINVDDAYAAYWRSRTTSSKVVTFGMRADADFRAREITASMSADGFRQVFTLVSPLGEVSVALNLGGKHNVMNALCAAAAASAAGATLAQIRAGLGKASPIKGRLQPKAACGGAWLIDDSYNANPSSLDAAFALLSTLGGEKWLVLGDMGELGQGTVEFHVEAGRSARAAGVTRLFAIGQLTGHAVAAFGDGARWFDDADELGANVRPLLHPGLVVLIKGSRVNRLERVVESLAATAPATR
jgi:UDP-N-acetylmuramoyl-tripeptide--D-alanyl-D-alanine ligase